MSEINYWQQLAESPIAIDDKRLFEAVKHASKFNEERPKPLEKTLNLETVKQILCLADFADYFNHQHDVEINGPDFDKEGSRLREQLVAKLKYLDLPSESNFDDEIKVAGLYEAMTIAEPQKV